jgi:transcriptional regulator with XRE-family HTH domain
MKSPAKSPAPKKPRDISVIMAERVLDLRTKANMTQAQLASQADVTVETIARLERVLRGKPSANANPSLETLDNIARALGVSADSLITTGRKANPSKKDRLDALIDSLPESARSKVFRVVQAVVKDFG